METRDVFIREEEDAAEDEEGREANAASSVARKATALSWSWLHMTSY